MKILSTLRELKCYLFYDILFESNLDQEVQTVELELNCDWNLPIKFRKLDLCFERNRPSLKIG